MAKYSDPQLADQTDLASVISSGIQDVRLQSQTENAKGQAVK